MPSPTGFREAAQRATSNRGHQLIANWNILHAREAYEDAEDLSERRHLLRLWLKAHVFTGANDLLREGIPERGD